MVNKEEKPKKGSFHKKKREKSEFEQKVIDIARVTRVVKGGKRFSFRTTIVIGDKKGRVGVGVAKGPDMKASTEKSFAQAKKNLVTINFKGNTIPYPVRQKVGSAIVLLKPAAPGRGIVAGGAVRSVIALVGISDITAKMLGAKNKLNNARATIEALETFSLKTVGEIKKADKKEAKAQKAVVEKQEEKSSANKTVVPKTKIEKEVVTEKKTVKAEKETKK
jgi:small subunit ribosomal protein S5